MARHRNVDDVGVLGTKWGRSGICWRSLTVICTGVTTRTWPKHIGRMFGTALFLALGRYTSYGCYRCSVTCLVRVVVGWFGGGNLVGWFGVVGWCGGAVVLVAVVWPYSFRCVAATLRIGGMSGPKCREG